MMMGVGPTEELSLRVSVAALVRVVYPSPGNGSRMLALERKATYRPAEGDVTVKAQPFGGALRINDLSPLRERIGDFHFDSQRSRHEQDFRFFIRPSAWEAVRDFCREQFQSPGETVLESSPARELAEEFDDALGIGPSPGQFDCLPLWTLLENHPAPTGNIHVENQPTVRIYRVFEARITNPVLSEIISSNSQKFSDEDLQELATRDLRNGGKGRANAFLVFPLNGLVSFYAALPVEQLNGLAKFEAHHLEPNVTALLEGIHAPKYQRL